MKLNSKLALILKERGITQRTLAQKTGLSPTTVNKLCRNYFDRVDCNTVLQICKFLQIEDLNYLFEIDWK